jgi:hypothetical protein
MENLLVLIGVIVLFFIVPLFIVRTGKRPEGCTCKSYNPIHMGPVDKCPVHKHHAEDDDDWYKGGHYPFSDLL